MNPANWFSALPQAHRDALLERARPRRAQAGDRVYGLGDAPDGLWGVVEGEVRLVSYPAVGVESVAMVLHGGGWFGELSVMDGGPRPHDALVVRPTRLLHVSLPAFEQVAAQHPLLYRDLGVLICARQRAVISFLGRTIAQPVSVRLARTLAGAARASGRASVALRQSDLANMVGVSRQTINKELRALERAAIVTLAYGAIHIRDMPALRRLSRPS